MTTSVTMTEMTSDIPDVQQTNPCEELEEIVSRQDLNIPVKVWVRNLPQGISESGLKNIFMTVEKPLSISFDLRNNAALVLFKSLKDAELAVRDMHLKPPYHLRLRIVIRNGTGEKEDIPEFSPQEHPVNDKEEDDQINTNEIVDEIKSIVKDLSYDPSLRMRQKRLDFQTVSDCISLGRGYTFMGKSDRFVGGLQKFEFASDNSRVKDKMNYFCENCKALTTKICSDCSVPFCSKICLTQRSVCHMKDCLVGSSCSDLNFDNESVEAVPIVPLKTGCTVVISTYLTMNTVFIRRSDEPWEEKFIRLCNDVAMEAMKGEILEEKPQAGDLVIGKYYQDLCFYRAQIISKTEENVILFFMDFGNSQQTNIEDLKPLPDHLKAVPRFAVKVQLRGVPDGSSPESVNYFNNLTAKRVPLILDLYENGEVVLSGKDLEEVVNETVFKFLQPSWKRGDLTFSSLGHMFFWGSIKQQELEIGKTYNLIISHFDEKEFLESEVFWVTNPETDDFFHVNSDMYLKVKEYCEFLKYGYYMPRENELCLAKENGEWHRCVNLGSDKTTCCLFFIDDGRSSLIDTCNIRKMVQDFIEVPSQVVCCTLPDDPKLKANGAVKSKVVQYLKESTGRTISSVCVMKLMGDAYCLSIPEIEKILAGCEPDT